MRTALGNKKHASCPGTHAIKTPALTIKKCPECGSDVEIFSDEMQTQCACGNVIYHNASSCVRWCRHAIECVGEETYLRLQKNKV